MMNYQKIHNSIIDRARPRIYDSSIYQKHHIIPLHEDRESKETVSLTPKEHRIIHHLRYKMGFGIGNKLAYAMMRGVSHLLDQKLFLKTASQGGKIGGAKTKSNKSGIFSDSWDRINETKRRHELGIMRPWITSENAHNIGKLSASSKRGIFSDNYDRCEASKAAWISMDDKAKNKVLSRLRSFAKEAGRTSYIKKAGFHSLSEEQKRINASKGGLVSGKYPYWTNGVETKKQIDCPGEGWFRGRTMRHKTTKLLTVYRLE